MTKMEYRKPAHARDIVLGSTVRCRVTGFTGTAISRVEYLTGCTQYGITPNQNEGKLPSTEYMDWQRLEALDGSAERYADLLHSPATARGDGAGPAPGPSTTAPTR